jgi:colicin import membrane protein
MHAAADRLEFAPPATPGVVRALLLALLAHGLLVAALTAGVQWKREAQIISAEAELWAAVPVEAAPRLLEPTEPVLPEKPAPVTPPEPVVSPPKVDIALEQEKKRLQKQKQLAFEQQQEKLKADKLKQALADKAKLAQEKKLTEQQARQLEAQRTKNLERMAGLAGASGGPTSSGTALKSAGPSASYKGRIAAYFKAHKISYLGEGNPKVVVRFSTSADGTVIGKSLKIVSSSGAKAWDDAVLRALEMAVLPRDTDGRVPPDLELELSPSEY